MPQGLMCCIQYYKLSLSQRQIRNVIIFKINQSIFKTQIPIRNIIQMFQKSSSRAIKTLLGVVILNVGMGVITIWGNINIYVFSYFYYQGTNITQSTNSKVLLSAVFPMIFAMVLAPKLSKRWGQQFTMRIAAIIFLSCPLFPLINRQNFALYIAFTLVIPASMFAFITVPALSCVWSQFPSAKNRVTAILSIALGIGTIIWNPIIAHAINPHNQQLLVSKEELSFFSKQVSQKVPNVSLACFLSAGALAFLGSLLIQSKKVIKNTQNLQKQDKYDVDINIQVDNQNNNIQANKNVNINNKEEQIQIGNAPSSKQNMTNSSEPQPRLTRLTEVFKDKKFILVMLFTLLSTLYEIQLALNLKIVYMPLINDDHFLSYCIIILACVAIGGAYIWGCIADRKGFAWTLLLLGFYDLLVKVFSVFVESKVMLGFLAVLIGLESKSLTTIVAPGFVQFYGIKLGRELIPYKGIAMLLGFIFAPLLQVVTASFLTPREYLQALALLCIITFPLSIYFYYLAKDGPSFRSQKQIDMEAY